MLKKPTIEELFEILGFASEEEINEVKNKVQSENRDGKIEAVIEGCEFVEKKLKDDLQYKELMKKGVMPLSTPSSNLFYLDYKLTHKKTRRAGKKYLRMNKICKIYDIIIYKSGNLKLT